jgi:hypothetical protein
MQVGINYAWKNYSWDFGLPPQNDSGRDWGPRAEWMPTIEADLAGFLELGLFCVRWFLLGDGTTYGIGKDRPHLDTEHPEKGPEAWRFDTPPPLSDEALQDFAELLACCDRAGIKLLPSLLDFRFCFPGEAVAGSSGIVKGGRSDVFVDAWKKQQFLEQVLSPLLQVASTRRHVIYAFEVINEPEWCTRPLFLPPELCDAHKTVPAADMQTFVRDAAGLINQAGFESTTGFALYQTLEEWNSPGLGLTLHQFHYYAEPAMLPQEVFDPRWPLIVGEFASARHRPWPDLGATQDVLSRLRHIEQKGYPAAFVWSANREEEHSADPPAVDFSDANRTLIRRYTRGG